MTRQPGSPRSNEMLVAPEQIPLGNAKPTSQDLCVEVPLYQALKKALAAYRRAGFIAPDEIRRSCVRGGDNRTSELFSYVDLEARAPLDHALRSSIGSEALSAL